jgi:RNA-directed DNA polymerase
LRGRAHLVRYADDAVMLLFEYEEDARRVMAVLPQRFGKYGLTLHPDKTRWLPFKRPDRMTRKRDDDGPDEPGTFDFLGFTIHWGKSPMTGKWVVKMRTAADRFRRALKASFSGARRTAMHRWRRSRRSLSQKLRGHYGYYGRKGNRRARLGLAVPWVCAWWHWLRHRSQRGLPSGAMRIDCCGDIRCRPRESS